MKPVVLGMWLALIGAASVATAPAVAQERVYRCGNEYTNQVRGRSDCKLVEGGNITVVTGTRVTKPATVATPSAAGAPAAPVRTDAAQQRARDADARAILEQELRRSETRQAELLKEYNNGQPEKIGIEARYHQKYLERVSELKAAIDRNQSDIEGIQRELARLSR